MSGDDQRMFLHPAGIVGRGQEDVLSGLSGDSPFSRKWPSRFRVACARTFSASCFSALLRPKLTRFCSALNLFAPSFLAFARPAKIDDLSHNAGLFAEGVDRHYFRFAVSNRLHPSSNSCPATGSTASWVLEALWLAAGFLAGVASFAGAMSGSEPAPRSFRLFRQRGRSRQVGDRADFDRLIVVVVDQNHPHPRPAARISARIARKGHKIPQSRQRAPAGAPARS